MADDDRQPPQSYDTVSPAGVGAASGNQMSPSAWQDLYFTGDQGLLDVLPPIQLPLEDLGRLGVLVDSLVPCVKRIYNDVYGCCYKIKNSWPKDVKLLMSP